MGERVTEEREKKKQRSVGSTLCQGTSAKKEGGKNGNGSATAFGEKKGARPGGVPVKLR